MLKFIKRLFILCLILLLAGGVWGYKNGMTKDNYKEFIAETIEKMKSEFPDVKRQDEKTDNDEPKNGISTKKPEMKGWKYELLPLPKNPFMAIDRHARSTPSSAEVDIRSLASHLQQNANTDLEKARAIYVWLADNIHYDDQAYNTKIYSDYSAENVLQDKKAVCEGISNLYLALGEEVELEIEKVSGYSKGYSYQPGDSFYRTNHAWNIIKIDGRWRIFDATWGGGSGENVNGKLVSKKSFNGYWFNVDPYEAIFSHFPEDVEQSFVNPYISLTEYELMPNVDDVYFEIGFDGKETYLEALTNPNFQAPFTYSVETPIVIKRAPKHGILRLKESYEFAFYIPRAYDVAMIDSNNKWTSFNRNNGNFRLEYTPKTRGELSIGIKHEKSGKSYSTILKYEVKNQRASI